MRRNVCAPKKRCEIRPSCLAGEGHPVPLEVLDAPRGALGHDLYRGGIGEQVALRERVGGVLLPAVLRVHGASAALMPPAASVVCASRLRALADDEHVDPPLCEFDCRAQPRTAGADDEHGGCDLLFSGRS